MSSPARPAAARPFGVGNSAPGAAADPHPTGGPDIADAEVAFAELAPESATSRGLGGIAPRLPAPVGEVVQRVSGLVETPGGAYLCLRELRRLRLVSYRRHVLLRHRKLHPLATDQSRLGTRSAGDRRRGGQTPAPTRVAWLPGGDCWRSCSPQTDGGFVHSGRRCRLVAAGGVTTSRAFSARTHTGPGMRPFSAIQLLFPAQILAVDRAKLSRRRGAECRCLPIVTGSGQSEWTEAEPGGKPCRSRVGPSWRNGDVRVYRH